MRKLKFKKMGEVLTKSSLVCKLNCVCDGGCWPGRYSCPAGRAAGRPGGPVSHCVSALAAPAAARPSLAAAAATDPAPHPAKPGQPYNSPAPHISPGLLSSLECRARGSGLGAVTAVLCADLCTAGVQSCGEAANILQGRR